MWTWIPSTIAWIDAWIRTPGFGGAAAVVAALIAYRGAARSRLSEDARAVKNRDDENKRALEARWWEQARWTVRLLSSANQSEVALGIQALAQLMDEAADAEAGRFARLAMLTILEPEATSTSPGLDAPAGQEQTGRVESDDKDGGDPR